MEPQGYTPRLIPNLIDDRLANAIVYDFAPVILFLVIEGRKPALFLAKPLN